MCIIPSNQELYLQCVPKVRLKSICLLLGIESTLLYQRSDIFSTRFGHFDIYFPKYFKIIALCPHGRPNGPLNGPCEADFWHPWLKRVLRSFSMIQIDKFSQIGLQKTDKFKCTAWFEVNRPLAFREIIILIFLRCFSIIDF